MQKVFVVFAPNGNVRLWSQDCGQARRFADDNGLPIVTCCAIPDGWQLVPKEPTKEMLEAANRDLRREYATLGLGDGSHLDASKAARNYYAAMLSAAPDATAEEARGWLPIETVPKDGTEVALLFAAEDDVLGQRVSRVRAASWGVDWSIPYYLSNPPIAWRPISSLSAPSA